MKLFKSLFSKEISIGIIEPTTETHLYFATQVTNYEDILSYICSDIHKSIRLTSQCDEKLLNLFGKHNTTFRGEFFYKIWILKFNNEIFQVFSSKRGLEICIVANLEDNKTEVILSFLETLDKQLQL